MKVFARNCINFLTMTILTSVVVAQDVIISVPLTNIISGVEFNTVENVLYTKHNRWQKSGPNILAPTFTALSSPVFRNRGYSMFTLPADVLHFRLKSIGGKEPIYHPQDTWPGFKIFSSSPQTWYEPHHHSHPTGNVDFTFKISASQFSNNAFHAGDYEMELTQNYGGSVSGGFTPERFFAVLSIPASISWLSDAHSKHIKITSLQEFRSSATKILGDFGPAKLVHTTNFNLWAKASSSSITFTSTNGVSGSRDISNIQLGSVHSHVVTSPLSATWKNFSSTAIRVEPGNKTDIPLHFSVLASDFKRYFFEAGMYSFYLNLEAKSEDNTISTLQNIDVTIEVPPLSEIEIPSSGQNVNFNFNTPTHYSQGQSQVINNQIRLSNNQNFELYVKSATSFFKKAGIQSNISSDILQIGVDRSRIRAPLTTTPQIILLNRKPVLDREFDIRYTIPADKALELASKEKTTYSIDVIYSFTAL